MEQGIRPFRVITPQADRTWVLPQGTGNGHNHVCSEENQELQRRTQASPHLDSSLVRPLAEKLVTLCLHFCPMDLRENKWLLF